MQPGARPRRVSSWAQRAPVLRAGALAYAKSPKKKCGGGRASLFSPGQGSPCKVPRTGGSRRCARSPRGREAFFLLARCLAAGGSRRFARSPQGREAFFLLSRCLAEGAARVAALARLGCGRLSCSWLLALLRGGSRRCARSSAGTGGLHSRGLAVLWRCGSAAAKLAAVHNE